MTKHFKAGVWLFDTEDFLTEHEVKDVIEGMMDSMTIHYEGLVMEKVKAKEVEIEEYEEED